MPRRGTSSKASVYRCFYVELYFDTAACMLLPSLFTFFPPIFAHAIINLKRDYHENTKISHFSQLSTISMISMISIISIISRFSHPSQPRSAREPRSVRDRMGARRASKAQQNRKAKVGHQAGVRCQRHCDFSQISTISPFSHLSHASKKIQNSHSS